MLVQNDTAVAVADLAVYKAGSIGSEEQDHLSRLARVSSTAQGDHADYLGALFSVVRQSLGHGSYSEGRAYSVAGDAVLAAFLGDGLGQFTPSGIIGWSDTRSNAPVGI